MAKRSTSDLLSLVEHCCSALFNGAWIPGMKAVILGAATWEALK